MEKRCLYGGRIVFVSLLTALLFPSAVAEIRSIDELFNTGDTLPGGDNATSIGLLEYDLTTGAIIFTATDDVGGTAIYRLDTNSSLTSIVHSGDEWGVPPFGIPPTFTSVFRQLDVNGGVVAFTGQCSGSCSAGQSWAWRSNGTELTHLQAEHSFALPAVTLAGNAISREITGFFRSNPTHVQVNDAGQVLFQSLFGDSTSAEQPFMLLLDNGGALPNKLLMSGDSTPTITGGTFSQFLNVKLGNDSYVYFRNELSGVASAENATWWQLDPDNTLSLIAQEGQAAPGYGGLTYTGFGKGLMPLNNKPGAYFASFTARENPFGGAAEVILYYGTGGASNLIPLLPTPDAFGRFNVSTDQGEVTFDSVSTEFLGQDDSLYFTGRASGGFSHILNVNPNPGFEVRLLVNSDTSVTGPS